MGEHRTEDAEVYEFESRFLHRIRRMYQMRTEIYEFAEELERVMSENDIEKGDSYKEMTLDEHRSGLMDEIMEWLDSDNEKNEMKELSDIGNRCWMLWRALKVSKS